MSPKCLTLSPTVKNFQASASEVLMFWYGWNFPSVHLYIREPKLDSQLAMAAKSPTDGMWNSSMSSVSKTVCRS